MLRRFRTLVTVLAAAALLSVPSVTFAATDVDKVESSPAPAVVDAAFIRPLGLGMLAVNALLWVPVAAITSVTRPQELGMVTEALIKKPARFVFSDPLGSH